MDWDALDIRGEETHEELPVPPWRPVDRLSRLEFEAPGSGLFHPTHQ